MLVAYPIITLLLVIWYVIGKFITKVGLLKNNPKVGLFTIDEWKVGLLISIFPIIYWLFEDFWSKN